MTGSTLGIHFINSLNKRVSALDDDGLSSEVKRPSKEPQANPLVHDTSNFGKHNRKPEKVVVRSSEYCLVYPK